MNPADALLQQGIERWLPEATDPAEPLRAAMRYSLQAGGKRLRPRLLIECGLTCGASLKDLASAAFAIECLHTYSLVHDDLPAMDDDELRRGKPTTHKAFGEAEAILAGDGLLTLAFEVLATTPEGAAFATRRAESVAVLARASGAAGMVGGQSGDLAATGKSVDLAMVRWIHRHKTAALFAASAEIGAVLASASTEVRSAFSRFGIALGLAFQIVDDVLDMTADSAQLGKTSGKDSRDGKGTYVSTIGIDGSRVEASQHIKQALSELSALGLATRQLNDLARRFIDRAS